MDLRNKEKLIPLIERCIKNDRRAQNELYREVFPYAMSIALRYSRDQEESLIIVNDAFYKVFRSLAKFDIDGPFQAWVRKIVINAAINYYHADKKVKEVFLELPDDFDMESADYTILDTLDAQHLLALIQQLPASYRMIFSLFAIEGYAHKEIAEQMNISEGASKSAYHKAKIKLKEALNPIRLTSNKQARHE